MTSLDRLGQGARDRLDRAAAWWASRLRLRVAVHVLAGTGIVVAGWYEPVRLVVGVPSLLAEACATLLSEVGRRETDNLRDALDRTLDALGREKDSADRARAQWLATLLRRFRLGDDERVTLYAYNRANMLVKVTRHAERPDWRTEGRDGYPTDVGLLGRVWQTGSGYEWDVPDPQADPDGFVRWHQATGLDSRAVADLDMPSRAYLGYRLQTDSAGHVGIVMFESVQPDGLADLKAAEDELAVELAALAAVVENEQPERQLDEEALMEGMT